MRTFLVRLSGPATLWLLTRVLPPGLEIHLVQGALQPPPGPGVGAQTGEAAVTALAGALTWAFAAWLTAVTLAVLLSAVPGPLGRGAHRLALAITPLAFRSLLGAGLVLAPGASGLVGLSTGLTAFGTGPVATGTALGSFDPGSDLACAQGLPGIDRVAFLLPSVDRDGCGPVPLPIAVTRGPALPGPTVTPAGPLSGSTYRVRPGDTLWQIAARELGSDPSPAQVAARWPQWWQANRAVLGADPSVLHPGQLLLVPAVPTGSSR